MMCACALMEDVGCWEHHSRRWIFHMRHCARENRFSLFTNTNLTVWMNEAALQMRWQVFWVMLPVLLRTRCLSVTHLPVHTWAWVQSSTVSLSAPWAPASCYRPHQVTGAPPPQSTACCCCHACAPGPLNTCITAMSTHILSFDWCDDYESPS